MELGHNRESFHFDSTRAQPTCANLLDEPQILSCQVGPRLAYGSAHTRTQNGSARDSVLAYQNRSLAVACAATSAAASKPPMSSDLFAQLHNLSAWTAALNCVAPLDREGDSEPCPDQLRSSVGSRVARRDSRSR